MSGPGPLRPYEKWLYPSVALWWLAVIWAVCVVFPSRPFVSDFDSVVAALLTLGAAVTSIIAYVLSRRP